MYLPINKGRQSHWTFPVKMLFEQLPLPKQVNCVHCVLRFIEQSLLVKFVGQTHWKSASDPTKLVTTHVPPFLQAGVLEEHGSTISHK